VGGVPTDLPKDWFQPSTTDDPADAYEPEEIVLPVNDILDPVVGSVTAVDVGLADAETLARAGVDATGSLRSGTMRLGSKCMPRTRSRSTGRSI
jgi:hypothetical protein